MIFIKLKQKKRKKKATKRKRKFQSLMLITIKFFNNFLMMRMNDSHVHVAHFAVNSKYNKSKQEHLKFELLFLGG